MSNRPLFDDDNLPAWLTNAGITGGTGVASSSSGQPQLSRAEAAAPSESSGDLSWMDSAWETNPQPAEPAAADSSGSLPWFAGDAEAENAAPATPAFEGDVPWLSDVQPSGAQPATGGWTPVEPEGEGAADSLPWMSDISPAQPSGDSAPSGTAFGGTGALPWRQGVSEPSDQPQSGQLNDSSADDLSWLNEPASSAQPAAPASAASDLDWMRDLSAQSTSPEQAAPASEPAGQADWMQDFGASAAFDQPEPSSSTPSSEPVTASDPRSDWLRDLDAQSATPAPAQPTPEPASAPDWKADLETGREATPVNPPPQPPQPVEPPKPGGLIKRLGSQPPAASQPKVPEQPAPAEPPAQPAIRKLPAQPAQPVEAPSQPASQGAIKKLPAKPQPAPTPPASQGPIRKLPAKPQPQAPQPDLSNMTYEEWERAQIEKEQEAKADPGDKLLEEIPDWFAGEATSAPETPPAASGAPAGAELMPEWFLGMEEKSNAPAPDWFTNIDLSATSLVGPETVQATPAPAETPAPAAASQDDVPDWFKGESPVAGLDFESMFVKSTDTESPGGSPKVKSGSLLPEDLKPEPVAPETPAEPANDLDWMGGMPDFGETVEQTAPPTPPAAPEAPADDLGWINDMPDFGETMEETTPPTSKPDSQPAMPAAPSEAETALPVAEDLLSDLDWLNEPVSRTPAEQSAAMQQTPETDQAMEFTPSQEQEAEGLADMLGALDNLEPEPAESSAQPDIAAPAAGDDIPEWMRALSPSELRPTTPAPVDSSASGTASEADWLAGVDFEQISDQTSAKAQPAGPAEFAAQDASLDLERKVGSSDIDSLLHLSSAESLEITRADREPSAVLAPQPEVNLDFESNALDSILGASTPEAPMVFTTDVLAGADADTTPPSPTEEQARPKRLTRLTSAEPEASVSEQTASGQPQEPLPDWIENLKPSEGPVVVRVGDQQVRMQEEPLSKVPAGMRRMREQAKALRERQTAAAAPESGPLSGIESAIPIVSEAIKAGALLTGAKLVITDQHERRVKIIHGILEQEDRLLRERKLSEDERAEQATGKTAARTRPRIKVDRLLITVLLALAVIAPFFTDALNLAATPDTTKLTPAQDSVARAIDAMQPDQPVLFAFEYGPTGAGELDTLARAAIQDILKHKARPIITSTNPSGLMHAQALMASMSANASDLQSIGRDAAHPLIARQDYVLLRYLPGGATGIRALVDAEIGNGPQSQIALSTDIDGQPVDAAAFKLDTLRSVPAFVLVESPEDVRNWAEQFRAAAPNKPLGLVFLSSATASATAQAYAGGSGSILGPLVGLRDAFVYQQVRGLSALAPKAASQRWQSIGLAGLLAVVVILFSSAINMIRSLRKRGTR